MTEAVCDAFDILACPVDGLDLRSEGGQLCCEQGHTYPVVEGVPVLLRPDLPQTIGIANVSIEKAHDHSNGRRDDPWFVATLGLSDEERSGLRAALASSSSPVDPVISYLVAATNGILYKSLVGKLETLPIPDLRLPMSTGERLIDVGCNWGRWSVAAARKGYCPIGIDPSLGAVLAAKRLATSLRLRFEGVVGDARYLPFKARAVDTAFSYSVLQHLSKPDALQALAEISRVLRPGGHVRVQMASATGVRSLQHILRRRGQKPQGFDVRYWSPIELRRQFARTFGTASLEVDCYFGLGLQAADMPILSAPARAAVKASEALRKVARFVPPLALVADSVYLVARKAA